MIDEFYLYVWKILIHEIKYFIIFIFEVFYFFLKQVFKKKHFILLRGVPALGLSKLGRRPRVPNGFQNFKLNIEIFQKK